MLFDLDGTLVDSALDFERIRREMGLPLGVPILETMASLPEDQLEHCQEILDRHEQLGSDRAVPVPGALEFLALLDRAGVRRAVVTRNGRRATHACLDRVGLRFDTVISREDAPPKPDPESLWMVCRAWEVPPSDVVVVGDYRYDIEAGRLAGMRTILITATGRPTPAAWAREADYVADSYSALTRLFFGETR